MTLAWPLWIVAICAVASFACIVIGLSVAGVAFARFSRHLDRTSEDGANLMDADRAEMSLARINNAFEQMPVFIERARHAIDSIRASLEALRLPEAMLALRTARAAVRLLFSGR